MNATCVLGCKTRDDAPKLTSNGYYPCDECADKLRVTITEIVELYATISEADLGTVASWRERGEQVRTRRPEFGPRAPVDEGLIAMLDPRTVAVDPGDPESALGVLAHYASRVRRARGMTVPKEVTIASESETLTFNWDWICRSQPPVAPGRPAIPSLGAVAFVGMARKLKQVHSQLKGVTGDPGKRPVGDCPNTVDVDGVIQPCPGRLYKAVAGDSVRCGMCKDTWDRREWLAIGKLRGVTSVTSQGVA